MDRRCGRVTHSLFAESKKEANQAKNSHVSLLKSLNQGEKQVWAISLHPKVVQTRLVFVDAGLRYASGWVRLTDKQSTTKKTLELMGHLRPVEMHRRKCRMNEVVSRRFSTHTVSINQPSSLQLLKPTQAC